MYLLPANQLLPLLRVVHDALPREASGLLVQREAKRGLLLSILPTPASDNTLHSFRISDESIAKTVRSLAGTGDLVCGCFHSHVLGPARPSKFDRLAASNVGGLWLIYSVRYQELNLFVWNDGEFRKERLCITLALNGDRV